MPFFDNDGNLQQNLLIKGNNLLALHSLKHRLSGKIKLIYIDPPYNTGNDGFKYNDNFNHSSWLVFMKNRLEIAKELLADDGVIFVHCDKNEFAYLKVLMDEIFNRNSYIETITVVNNPRGRDYGGIANMHEYIHIYAKNIMNYELYKVEDPNKEFPYQDDLGGYETRELRNRNTAFNIDNRPNLCYPFYVNPKNEIDNGFLEISLDYKKGFIEVMPAKSMGVQTVWRWGKEKSKQNLNVNIVGKAMKENGRYMIVEKYRDNTRMERSVWWDKEVNSERGTIHLRNLFGEKVFNFPKPEELIKRIIIIATNPNDIVLDFCVGSGTTCAVAHKMGRRWIGIEQMDYIDDITKVRLQKVLDGEQGGISKTVNWQGGGAFVYFELKKYNQYFIEKITHAKNMGELDSVYKEMANNAFFKFWFNKQDFQKVYKKDDNDNPISLDERKKILIHVLDENQLYLNYADMDDKRYQVSDDDKALSKLFYGE